MIGRWILQIEAHRGRWPRARFRRAPRSGDVVWNGDILCVLQRCYPCGEGFIAKELAPRVDRHSRTVGFEPPVLLQPHDETWHVHAARAESGRVSTDVEGARTT